MESEQFCQGKSKARVWFQYPGQKVDCLETDKTPVSYSLDLVLPGGANDNRFYIVEGTLLNANTGIGGCRVLRKWNSPPLQAPGFSLIRYPNGGFTRVRNAAGDESPIVEEGSGLQEVIELDNCQALQFGYGAAITGSIQISGVRLAPGQGDDEYSCLFTIFGNGEKLLERRSPVCPKVKVSCGDDCPEGEFKCDSSAFPGFKCVPCRELLR